MNIHISEDINDLSKNFAGWLVQYADEILQKQDIFNIVLSGGSTPKLLHKLLASDDYKNKIDWSKWHFFMGDERYVPFEDDRNNGKMAYETLLNHVPVKKENIHFMDTSIPADQSAKEYGKLLHNLFDGKEYTFDLVLLGMGDDGHTLSLFPGTDVVNEREKWVAAPFVKAQDMYRITLTQPVVSKAKAIVFLAAGEKKAVTLKEVLQGDYQPNKYPSQLINTTNKNVYWFVDEQAAALLKSIS